MKRNIINLPNGDQNGDERAKKLVLVANHVSILDPVYIGLDFKKIRCISC